MATNLLHRTTEQRRVILEELGNTKSHPTAAEVYEAVRKRIPQISLGTVYRNLDVLARSGQIAKVVDSDAASRFDADLSQHCHVRCTECGQVDDVTDVRFTPSLKPPDFLSGYEVVGHRLEYLGVCPECQRKRGEKGAGHGECEGDADGEELIGGVCRGVPGDDAVLVLREEGEEGGV
jgi:Fur family transcriptional regulator, ferric uptake regulator